MQNSLFSGVREKNKELVNKLKNRKKATKQVSKNKLKAQLNNIEKRVQENFTEEEKQKIEVITDQQKLYKFFTKDELYAVDTESDVVGSNPDPMLDTLVGLSGYSKNNNGIYVPMKHKKTNLITFNYKYDYDKQLTYEQVSEVFREIDKKFIFHNSVYDIRVFINALGQFDKNSTGWETYIASTYLNENEKHSLKYLYDRYVLGKSEQESKSFKDLFKDINISLVPIYLASLYGAKDAIMTYELYEFQREYLHPEGEYIDQTGLKEAGKFYLNWEIPTIKAVINMEERGFDFDSEYAKELSKKYTDKINKIEKEIHDFLDSLDYSHLSDKKKSKLGDPINLNSPTQLSIVIYDVLKLDYEERTTAADALKYFRDTATDEKVRLFFDNMLKERKISKLLSTYIDKLPEVVKSDGKIHTRLNQVGAKTGRFSSSEPNCYDEKTEILTDSGWKLFKDLDKTEKVAQWKEDGEIEFVRPLGYIVYKYEGVIYKFKGKNTDLSVIPGHKIVSEKENGDIDYRDAETAYFSQDRMLDYKTISYEGEGDYYTQVHIGREIYEGYVYSVTVPSGNIVVRRNNKEMISGNCQNIPSDNHEIRQMFKADDGKVLISTDYS